MAIKKVLSVKNVGRLVDCSQKGPEFKRCNLLFAENGRGKTTLCAVLRSLQTGERVHVDERRTLGAGTRDPAATIRIAGGTANFGAKGWSTTVPEITIFDAMFIARNVHAGEYVDREHRSKLLEVIVGEAGVGLAQGITRLDEAIRRKNADIAAARKAVEATVPTGAKLERFVSLSADPDVEARIAAKRIEVDAGQQAEAIIVRAGLSLLTVPVLPTGFVETLRKTLNDVAADAETKLVEHIARHKMQDRGQSWLTQGLGYEHSDTCPFCGQNIKPSVIIGSYTQYFSDGYKTLVQEAAVLVRGIESALGEAAFANLEKQLAENAAHCQFWRPFLGDSVVLPALDDQLGMHLADLREAAKRLASQKQREPLTGITTDAAFDDALAALTKSTEGVTSHNVKIEAANTAIAVQKAKVAATTLAVLKSELAALEMIQLRHEAKIAALCEGYLTLQAEKVMLDKDKVAAKEKLDVHSATTIKTYETSINRLLKSFGAGFSLTNSKQTYVGGTPTSTYQILINEHAVDLGDSSTPPGQLCFRTTLSSGDKSTLALAFFLAQLEHDPKKAERVVVFDDPFNSQDRSRRERTAELLKKCGRECAQLLLLSHDPRFLKLVHDKLPAGDRHVVQLSRVPGNASTIEEWDIVKETQEAYFQDHAALVSYNENGPANCASLDIIKKMRVVLEGHIRYRFPGVFGDKEWLGGMIKSIRETNGAHPMSPALVGLERINDYSKRYHHNNPENAVLEVIDDGELQTFVQETLEIVGGY